MLGVRERAPIPFPFVVFNFGLVVESIKEFRGASRTLSIPHTTLIGIHMQ
jgi:hypothetical protein